MAPGGGSKSESPILRPRILQASAPDAAPEEPPPVEEFPWSFWWKMDDAPALAEEGGGPPFVAIKANDPADMVLTQAAPLAPGSIHSVYTTAGTGIKVSGLPAPFSFGTDWYTWEYWASFVADFRSSSVAQFSTYPTSNSRLSVGYLPGGIQFSTWADDNLVTVPMPPNPVHVQWSFLINIGKLTRSIIRVNGTVCDDQALDATWSWGGSPECVFSSGHHEQTVDEVKLYKGVPA